MTSWSATQYSAFENERTRPVRDLVAALPNRVVKRAVDLGCGPGNSTEVLLQRYPDAQVTALDSDPDMIDKARERKRLCIPRVRTVIADIAGWSAPEPQDLILANASLQWVPDHASLYPHLVRQLSEGASLAVQTPDNLDEPAHRQLREIASQGPWAASTSCWSANMQAAASSMCRTNASEPRRIGVSRARSWMRAFGYSCSTTRWVFATSRARSSRAASW